MLGVAGALGLTLVVAACGEDNPSDGDGGGAGDLEDVVAIDGSEAEVTALDNTFNEQNIQVAPGTKVVWTNDGRQDHNIVPANDGGGFGVDTDEFGPDAVYEHTFGEPGVYRYYCSLHGTSEAGMIGAVVVEE